MARPKDKLHNGLLRSAVVLVTLLQLVLELTLATKKGLYFEYLAPDMLRLKCHVGQPSNGCETMSIAISNATSKEKLAFVTKGNDPKIEKPYLDGNLFLAGGISVDPFSPAYLEIILIGYRSDIDQAFHCNVTWMHSSDVQIKAWTVYINKTGVTTQSTTTTPGTYTDAPYRVGPVKEKEIDAESLPMTVLIVMLVLISILLFLAVFLLLHRYRSRCQRRDEDLYRPPAYCLAPDHHLDWTDSSTIKSKGSARTLNSRSHYSIAAHHMHMPLPPIPHSPRRTKTLTPDSAPVHQLECQEYMHRLAARRPSRNSAYRRPPSVGSSVRVPYVQPQDAIGQESSEDGEIAALSSGSPKVHYKSPRDRPTRQNSPLYACVPVSSTDE